MNKVKFGLRNIYYAKLTTNSETGDITYGTPVHATGAISLSLSPVGDNAELYAEDSLYFTQANNQGYSGEMELALLNDSFLTDIMGYETDDNGALIENADQVPSAFALGFEVQGDTKGKRIWFYNCTCARPNQEASTKTNGIEPSTDKLSIVVAPRLTDKQVKAVLTLSDTNVSAYNSFFTSVYEEVNASA